MNRVLAVDGYCIRNACIKCFVCNFDKSTVASCCLLIFSSFVSISIFPCPLVRKWRAKGNLKLLSTVKTLLCKIQGS